MVLILIFTKSISKDESFSFSHFLPSANKTKNKIDMSLWADSRWKGLVSYLFLMKLFSKADWINNTFNLFKLFWIIEEFNTSCILIFHKKFIKLIYLLIFIVRSFIFSFNHFVHWLDLCLYIFTDFVVIVNWFFWKFALFFFAFVTAFA